MLHVWNNAFSTLNGSINNSQLTATLTDASVFWDGVDAKTKPSLNNPSFLTIITYNTMSGTESTDSTSGRVKVEMIPVIGISGNIITIDQRGYSDTVPQSFSSGAYIYKFVDKEDALTYIKFISLSLSPLNNFNF